MPMLLEKYIIPYTGEKYMVYCIITITKYSFQIVTQENNKTHHQYPICYN